MQNKINIEGIKLYAYHGCLEEEAKIGRAGKTLPSADSASSNLLSGLCCRWLCAASDFETGSAERDGDDEDCSKLTALSLRTAGLPKLSLSCSSSCPRFWEDEVTEEPLALDSTTLPVT